MLDYPCFITIKNLIVVFPVFVIIFDADMGFSFDLFTKVWYAETPFIHGHLLTAFFNHVGVYECLFETRKFRFILSNWSSVDDENSYGFSNLGCSKTQTLRMIHCIKKIINKLLQLLIILFNICCDLFQNGMTVNNYRICHFLFSFPFMKFLFSR